jgi:S-DNA-T family DNA segregation ATPase FtsK/SpoIIIE
LGVLILSLALLTLIGLVSPARGTLSDWWVGLVRRAFGWGGYLAPVALAVLGVWVIKRGTERPLVVPPARLWGLGLLYLAGLALAHHLTDDPLAARAAGQGGGAIGYALSAWLVRLVGWTSASIVWVALTGIGLILALDVSLAEVLADLAQAWQRLRERARARRGSRLSPAPTSEASEEGLARALSAPIVGQTPTIDRPLTPLDATPSLRPIVPGETPLWKLPHLEELLAPSEEVQMSERDMVAKAHVIEETLDSLGVPVSVVEVNPGPVVTQFGLEPGYVEHRERDGTVTRVKVKVSRIAALANDLSLALAASPIRIEAPVPGKGVVGIEVPNSETSVVGLRSVMESDEFRRIRSRLAVALGRDVSGRAVADDLTKLPHLLIAGATGSGKSVCINALIACLICRNSPDDLRLLMIDPKRVELSLYGGIPHLLAPVIVEAERVVGALKWVTQEMERRYQVFARVGVRNLQGYNKAAEAHSEPRLPYIVVFLDELAELMMVAAEEVERLLCRIAQMARATGIHLVIATQRPSVDVLTGLIKANFPARMAFAVTSQVDSRVVLDVPGADKLLGRGDGLYMAPDSPKLMRVQGCYVSDVELTRLVNFWKGQVAERAADASVTPEPLDGSLVQKPLWPALEPIPATADGEDPLLEQATELVRSEGRASVSFLQRHLRIGYTRAARLIDRLQEQGVIGPPTGSSQQRPVLAKEESDSD